MSLLPSWVQMIAIFPPGSFFPDKRHLRDSRIDSRLSVTDRNKKLLKLVCRPFWYPGFLNVKVTLHLPGYSPPIFGLMPPRFT